MPSPLDSQPFSSSGKADGESSHPSASFSPEGIDLNQVYTLIDSILPFEACLYYQVLPLIVEGSRLMIGMVNLEDQAASEYVKKQFSYINYSITFKEIQSEWHRDLLSKYLSHTAKVRQHPQPTASATSEAAGSSPSPSVIPPESNLQTTFIVDQPDEISDGLQAIPPAVSSSEPHAELHSHQPLDATPKDLPTRASSLPRSSPTAKPLNGVAPVALPMTPVTANSVSGNTVPPLHLQISDHDLEIEEHQLATLTPKVLMQVLLSKVLEEGIGRLYFERRANAGRILWSKDGVLQSVLESLESQVLQGVINEFKLLTHMSLIAVKKPRQVEIERLYENQRILLRFRVMPHTSGEEATLQVLRGTALRFYQQQQIDRLGRDALDAAQVLQHRLNDIRDRARQSLNFKVTRSETLPAIIQLLKQMEAQVQEIVSTYDLDEKLIAPPTDMDV